MHVPVLKVVVLDANSVCSIERNATIIIKHWRVDGRISMGCAEHMPGLRMEF